MLKFLGIGAQKSATTWLYDNLNQHPEISFPGGKEVHFWNARVYQDGLSWYKSLFSGSESLCEGDITPAYSLLDEAMIQQVKNEFPSVRIIFIVRNPIERAWSSAKMALGRAELTMNEASDQWFYDHFNSSGSIGRGDYFQVVAKWLKAFPEDFLLLEYEEIQDNPAEVLQKCYRFLELSNTSYFNETTLNSSSFKGAPDSMKPEYRDALTNIYTEKIDAFSELVGKDFSKWYRS